MKKNKLLGSIGALALAALAFTAMDASAISITVNEDSATRLDFTVNWGASSTAPDTASYTVNNPPTSAFVVDEGVAIQIVFSSIFSSTPGTSYNFYLFLEGIDTGLRELSSSILIDAETGNVASESDYGVDIMSVAGNDYAARFVVGEALPPDSVPDGGMTVAMLGVALGGLGLLRRKF